MQEDISELNPGRVDFWVQFYSADDGRLHEKEQKHRRSRDIAERGSLRDHYEWFMEYAVYEETLKRCLRLLQQRPIELIGAFHLLHVGCGNSDFCGHAELLLATCFNDFPEQPEILNLDICENIIDHLLHRYPARRYAVGSCCNLGILEVAEPAAPEAAWYTVDVQHHLRGVRSQSVHFVFDKGTADALLSAFAGDYNPNMDAYVNEMVRVLHPGGLMCLISINSEDVLGPYFLSAAYETASFELVHKEVIELGREARQQLRVETLGTHYRCYCYEVVLSAPQ